MQGNTVTNGMIKLKAFNMYKWKYHYVKAVRDVFG